MTRLRYTASELRFVSKVFRLTVFVRGRRAPLAVSQPLTCDAVRVGMRAMPTAPADLDPTKARHLRDAFGAFATGVTVVTAVGADGGRVGLTANSLTSVSLDPPLLLFCPARGASALPTLRASRRFAVNVLAADQTAVADRFARRDADRFAGATWHDLDGLPVLNGALASFACSLEAEHDGGDHVVVVGRVLALRCHGGHDPLLYFRGAYRRVHVPT